MMKNREGKQGKRGRRGRYILTGFVACGNCGGPMSASKNEKAGVVYQCANHRNYADAICEQGKSYSERLILPHIIKFLAGFMFDQLALFHTALNDAAAHYHKSVTEEKLEAEIQGELESVQAGKQRIVEAISLGVMTNEEAAKKLDELREKEQRLTIEVATIAEKAAIMAEWQQTLETVKDKDKNEIATRLRILAEKKPVAFRRVLSLVFEPNSLRVKTERVKGKKWGGKLEGYTLTATIKEQATAFETKGKVFVTKDTLIFELAELIAA